MTPEEKIEALREWAGQDFPDEWASGASGRGEYWRGYFAAAKMVRDIIDPPKPKWRQMADAIGPAEPPLHIALWHLAEIANDRNLKNHLAGIIAVAEAQVGDGWQADPDSNEFYGDEQHEHDVFWLLNPLASCVEPLSWKFMGNRSAAWLRSLTDGGAE